METSVERKLWEETTVRNSRTAYQAYLDQYPTGEFRIQAERHLAWFDRFDHRQLYAESQQSGLPWKWILLGLLAIGAGLAIGYFM